MMVYVTFGMFKLLLALVAFTVMTADFIKHRELKYLFIAYAFLALSAASLALKDFSDFAGLDFGFHFFGITMAGLLFAKTSYSANKRIRAIRNATKVKLR